MYKDAIKFEPNYESYLAREEEGAVQVVVVRDDGRLIGYYISFIYQHPHYKNDLFAVNDILFLERAYRGSTIAYRMFKYAEKELKKLGVSVIMMTMKTQHPFVRLCESLGMEEHEIVYSKYIGG